MKTLDRYVYRVYNGLMMISKDGGWGYGNGREKAPRLVKRTDSQVSKETGGREMTDYCMTAQWVMVKVADNGVSLWRRFDMRNRYAAYDNGKVPSDNEYGIAKKNAVARFAIKAGR